MTERTYPGTIAAICREALAGRAERVTLTEERTGGDGRARFDVVLGGERFRVSVARNPLLDVELDADGVPRATRALKPARAERDRVAAVLADLVGAIEGRGQCWEHADAWCSS